MNGLELLYVAGKGDIDKERVVLKATTKLDLIGYILLNSYSEDGQTSYDLNDKVFWFPSKIVNAGEYIRIYTKSGKYETTQGTFKKEPATFHDFYWRLSNPIWTEKSNTAAILQVQNWHFKKI